MDETKKGPKMRLPLLLGAVPVLALGPGATPSYSGESIYGTPESIAPRFSDRGDLMRLSLSNADIPKGDWRRLTALSRLAEDVFRDPVTAGAFSAAPEEYLASIGSAGVKLDPSTLEVRVVLALGDEEIRRAVRDNDPKAFLVGIERLGILHTPDAEEGARLLHEHERSLATGDIATVKDDPDAIVALAVAYLVAAVVQTTAAAVNVVAAVTVAVWTYAVVKSSGNESSLMSNAPAFQLGRALGGAAFGSALEQEYFGETLENIAQGIEQSVSYRESERRLSGLELRDLIKRRMYSQAFSGVFSASKR